MEARWLTVGPVQENTWIARLEGAEEALLIDPGDEPERIKGALQELKTGVAAILITHCHFDHVGAVAEMARSTGAPVYCPAGEVFILEDINEYVRFPGFGPFESYSPEETVKGGDTLELAGFTIDVISTPGHSPDHVTYSLAEEKAIFSGDVLFQGSIGRTDLPGADHPTLMRSIATLLDALPDETGVLPGHMNPTTLGSERANNPFLRELAAR
jgi:glyoxylase-like metal-dependent hydrolase (beta-lactamase superfamily II)